MCCPDAMLYLAISTKERTIYFRAIYPVKGLCSYRTYRLRNKNAFVNSFSPNGQLGGGYYE